MAKLMVLLNLLLFLGCFASISQGQLQFGFYAQSCPNAKSIVRSVVNDAIRNDATMAAVLLRLHFHDCFVEVNSPENAHLFLTNTSFENQSNPNKLSCNNLINRVAMVRSWSTMGQGLRNLLSGIKECGGLM